SGHLLEAPEPSPPELPLEETSELEPLRQRQPALMTVATARRERAEVAQEGRRLPRRSLPYARPELLPLAEVPAPTPLPALVSPASGEPERAPLTPLLREPRSEEDHTVTTMVEGIRAPAASSSETPQASERHDEPRSAPAPWTRSLPPRRPGGTEGN